MHVRTAASLALTACMGVVGTARAQPATPNQVIADLMSALNSANLQQYEALLHADFHFYLDPETATDTQVQQLDRVLELEIAEAMFSGQPGPTAPITNIEASLSIRSNWVLDETPGFEGWWRRVYEAQLRVTYADQTVADISGEQIFHVVATGPAAYQLVNWRDLGVTEVKATESRSWSQVKMGFATGIVPTLTTSIGGLKGSFVP